MGRALAILTATFLVVALLTSLLPRIAPPGGPGPGALVTADYVFMSLLPLGAFFAGRHWYRYELYLLYGAAGLALFIPAFLADRNNHNRQYFETYPGHDAIDAVVHDSAAWTIALVAAAAACMFIARWAHAHFPNRR